MYPYLYPRDKLPLLLLLLLRRLMLRLPLSGRFIRLRLEQLVHCVRYLFVIRERIVNALREFCQKHANGLC